MKKFGIEGVLRRAGIEARTAVKLNPEAVAVVVTS